MPDGRPFKDANEFKHLLIEGRDKFVRAFIEHLRIGSIIDGYRTNLHQDRLANGTQFLQLVGGQTFETLPARIVALQNLSNQLIEAHHNWDNYYNEPPIMKEILAYCKKASDIPAELMNRLAFVVMS